MAKFVKGQSGNPGGRPNDSELRELCRASTKEAVETLLTIMRSKKTPAAAKVTASVALLDRGYGKPVQAIEHSGAMNYSHTSELSDADLERIAGTGKKPRGKTNLAAVVPINGASRTASNEQPAAASPPAVGEVGAEPTSAA